MRHQNKSAFSSAQRLHSEALTRAIARRDRRATRLLGERLFRAGGIALLQAALETSAGDHHIAMTFVDAAWDGLGGKWWR
jgi:hypothetical protein